MQGHDVDRVKMEWGYEVTCAQCGKRFTSKRSDASFCNANCRKRSEREVERWNAWIDNLEFKGREFVDVARKFKRSRRMYEAFIKLQKSLQVAIEEFEDV